MHYAIWIGAIWIGTAVTVAGVLMLLYCVVLANRIRRSGLAEAATRAALQKVLYWNMGGLFVAVVGLMAVVVGVILA
ncbi:MAG: hypothetical protein ABI832_06625 [bacterium]